MTIILANLIDNNFVNMLIMDIRDSSITIIYAMRSDAPIIQDPDGRNILGVVKDNLESKGNITSVHYQSNQIDQRTAGHTIYTVPSVHGM